MRDTMEFIKPNALYFDEYLTAVIESYEHSVTEWMPVKPEDFDTWKENALHIYALLENGDGLPAGIPRMISFWCVDGKRFVGEIQIRPYLSAEEAKALGHIGYAVRYSLWGHGLGTRLLQFATEKLHEYSVNPIYIACHTDNIASNRICRKVGFQFLETRTENHKTENVYVLYAEEQKNP